MPSATRSEAVGNDVVLLMQAMHFAAEKHSAQRRKGSAEEPYVNHLAEVGRLVAEATEGRDVVAVLAAILHDTLEDTKTTPSELSGTFGPEVAGVVGEVTDDKSLPKSARKLLQVEKAAHKSARAKLIKIADKTSNLRSITESPPTTWSAARKREYFDWAAQVVQQCRGTNAWLEARFDEAYAKGLSAL